VGGGAGGPPICTVCGRWSVISRVCDPGTRQELGVLAGRARGGGCRDRRPGELAHSSGRPARACNSWRTKTITRIARQTWSGSCGPPPGGLCVVTEKDAVKLGDSGPGVPPSPRRGACVHWGTERPGARGRRLTPCSLPPGVPETDAPASPMSEPAIQPQVISASGPIRRRSSRGEPVRAMMERFDHAAQLLQPRSGLYKVLRNPKNRSSCRPVLARCRRAGGLHGLRVLYNTSPRSGQGRYSIRSQT